MSDDDKRGPGSVRRVTAKDRKDKLEYGQNLFPPEQPLVPDPRADLPEPDEPLPFDEDAFAAQTVERFPPLPFDGEDPLVAQEAERFPPLPKPGWARHEAEPVVEAEAEAAPPPSVSTPVPARRKTPKPAPKKRDSRGRGCLYNILTFVFFVLTIGALIYGIYLFNNPFSPLNPLPPMTPLPIVITATPEPQQAVVPAMAETATPIMLDLDLTTEEAPAPTATELAPTATYTPLPPEVLTELAPAPTQENFDGGQAAT